MDRPAAHNVTSYRLTAKIAQARIREIAATSGNIKWSSHALDRMDEREIFDVDVLRILRRGMVVERPQETPLGEWKCKVVYRLRGSREAGVVTILMKNTLLVKTVEWEDLQ